MAENHEAKDDDYVDEAVPLSERRGPLTMGLLWITMVTIFPSVLIGFQWYKEGLTLLQVIGCSVLSCLILLSYSIPATQLGAKTGLGYAKLSRSVFGAMGSRLIAINLIWLFVLAYGLTALLMGETLVSLFKIALPLSTITAITAVLMAFNNFFGFKGVANFARFVAAPALIAWVGYTFVKALTHCPTEVLTQTPHVPFSIALTSVSSFVIGLAVWGNELDYWRFSRPQVKDSAIALIGSLAVGMLIFPITGWMVAKITGVTEYSAATALMNQYSFGGIALLPAIVLGASYFACNDSTLFGSLQAAETLKKMSHQKWALILGILGAATGAWLSTGGTSKSIEAFCSLNCIIMPTPTVIMMSEWFLQSKVFKDYDNMASFGLSAKSTAPLFKMSACIALTCGFAVGVLTSGLIPAFEFFHVGISSLQAWMAALVTYVPLRLIEYKRERSHFVDAIENSAEIVLSKA